MRVDFPWFLVHSHKKIMRIKSLLFLVVLLTFGFAFSQVVPAFNAVPAANGNNTIVVCQGQTILYTNASTGTNNQTNYNWTFQGGNPNNSNQVGPHSVTYNNAGNYTTTLNLGNGNSTQVNVNVVANNFNPTLTIPNGGQFSTTTYNGITIFRKCGAGNNGNFTFTDPNLATYPAGTSFNYSWGDGTSGTGSPSSISHNYVGQGYYNLTYSVTFPSGCVFTVNYQVYVGSNPPAITLSGSGSSSCLPNPYSFTLGTPTTPPAGTVFQVIYNDGTPTTFINSLSPNPLTINHVFSQTSCGINSTIQSTTYTNSYAIQVVATNGCNPQGTFAAIGPISAGGSVNAGITTNPNTNVICVNSPITFQDASNHGTNVYGGSCDSLFGRYWTISPNAGFTTAGTLGSSNGFLPNTAAGYDWLSWTNGSQNLPVTWTVPGNYQVTLHLGNDCGLDSTVYNICVVAATVANFSLPVATACAPAQISPINSSSTPGCNLTNVFSWAVTSTNPQNCNFNGGASVTPANSALANPTFNFNGPGVYNIQLTLGLNNNVLGASCAQTTFSQQITIKGPPQFSINPVGPICAGGSISPTITLNNCYGLSPASYAWNFNPNNNIPAGSIPAPLTANTLNPGSITYPSSVGSPFPFQLTATNECGPTTVTQNITVQNPVVVTTGSYGPFCINSPVPLSGTVTGGVLNGNWTANVAGGSFSPVGGVANSGALVSTYTPPAGYSGNIVFTLTSNAPLAPCQVVTAQTTVTFNQVATVNAGAYPNGVCMNQPLILNGTIGGAASSATWTTNSGGTFSNPNALNSTWTPPLGFTGTATLTLTTNDPAGPCNAAVATTNVTVKPLPVATSPVTVGPICSGANGVFALSSTLTPTNYNWAITSVPPGVVATASGTVNSNTNSGTLTTPITNNTNAPQTLTYVFTPVSNGCPGTPSSTQITIQPVATISALSNLTVCPGATLTPTSFVSNPNGATFTWTNNNANIGLAVSGSGQIAPWTAPVNNSLAIITGTVSVSPTFNACPGTNATFTVNISQTPSITNANLAQSICSGANTTAVTWTSALATTTYAWTGVASAGTVTGFTASGNGVLPSMAIVNSGNSPQTVTYTVTPTRNGCPGTPITYVITINPTPILTLSANQTVCGGSPTAVTGFSNSVAGGSFTFALQNPASVPVTITGNPVNGSGQIPASTINNAGVNPYTLNYLITPTAANCPGATGVFSITINPAPVTNFSIANQSICTGGNTASVNLSSATPGVSFSWSVQGAIPAGLQNFNPISGASTIPVYSNLINSTISPIVITIMAQATTTGPSQCLGSMMPYSITVNPTPTAVASFVSNDTICSNSQIDIALTSNTPNTNFTWTAVNGNGITGGAASVNPGVSITQTLVNATVNFGTVTYTITPVVAGACPGVPIQVVANVNPVSVVTGLNPLTFCPGSIAVVPPFTSSPLGASFSWTNSNAVIGLAVSGNGNIQNFTAGANNTNLAISGNVVVTPTFNGCPGTPSNFNITINPTPTVTNPVVTQTICSGAPTLGVVWQSGVAGTTYAWSVASNGNNVSGFLQNGSGNLPIQASIVNSGNSIQNVVYTVVPTANGCVGISSSYTIQVNPIPVLTLSTNQNICSGTATLATQFTNSVAGGGYAWSVTNGAQIPNTVTGFVNSGSNQIPVMTLNNVGTANQVIAYSVTPNANGCNGQPGSFQVTVFPSPTSAFSIAPQTICSQGNTQAVTITSTTANATFAWSAPNPLPNGLTNFNPTSGNTSTIPSFQNLTNATNLPISVVLTAIATTSGNANCPGPPANYTITINPTVIAQSNFVSNDTICSGTQISIGLTSTTPNAQFTWTVNQGNGISGASPSAVSSATIQQTLTNNTGAIGQVTYLVTPQVGACLGTPIQVIAYVKPVATLSPLNNLAACPGAPLTPSVFTSIPAQSTYSWTNSNVQVGLLASGIGNIPTWNAPINNGVTTLTSVVNVTPSYQGCNGTPSSFTITVYPTPSITTLPLSQTVCEGQPTTPITFTSSLPGSSIAWAFGNAGPSLTTFNAGSGQNPLPSMTVSHSGNTAQNIIYLVQATSANNCVGVNVNYTIIVNPNPIVTSVQDQTLCSGQSTVLTSYQNSVQGGGFTWSLLNANIPNAVTGYVSPSGTGQIPAAQISNSGTQPYILNYLVTPNASGCNGIPDTFSITVMPAPTVVFAGGNTQTVCSGLMSNPVSMSSTTPNVIWSWNVTNVNGVVGANPISGNGATVPAFTLTQNTNTSQNVVITAQASTTNGGCQGTLATYTIVVNPIPVATLTLTPGNVVCSNGTVNLNLSSNVNGSTFSWTSNATAGITGNTNASGAVITNTLVNSTSNVGTVTYSITPTASNCPGLPISQVVSVNPVPIVTGLSNLAVCPGSSISPAAFQSVPAGSTFSWSNSNTNIGLVASGLSNITSWQAPVNNGNSSQVGTITVTPTFGNGCVGTPSSFTVTVYPTPQITTVPLSQTLCENVASQAVNFTSNIPNSTINWSFANAGAGLSGHPTGQGVNPLPTITFSNALSTTQTAQYTVTATSANQCVGTPATYTFTVNPIPVLTAPGVQTVCSGQPTTSVAFSADVIGSVYTWTAISPPAGLSGFTANGASNLGSMTISNATANPLQLVYSVTPSAAGCSGLSGNFTFTVNPSPTVIFSIGNQSLCSGSLTNPVNLTTSTNNATISWTVAVPGGILGLNTLSGNNSIPAYNLTNNTAGNLTATFTAIASTAGNTVCPGTPAIYTLTISPQNGISVVAVDSSLCSGSSVQIQISSNTAGLTYSTVATPSQGVTGASNVNGTQISQVLVNNTNSQGNVTYTVTASAPPGSTCPSQTVSLPITVEPVPTVQYSIANQSLCSGNTSQIVNLTTNVAGASIVWNANVPVGIIGMQASGSNSIPGIVLNNATNASGVITINALATVQGCPGVSNPYQITVFPNPTLTINPPNDTICSNTNIAASFSSNVANTNYAWTISSNPNITGASNGSGNTINQVLNNVSAQIQSITYNVNSTGPGPNGGCPGQVGALNVWVNPVASVTFSLLNQTLCSGSSSQAVSIISPTPNAQISWTASIPAGITGAVANGLNTIPAQNLVNNTNGPLTIVYTTNVSTPAGNCAGQISTYSITVNPIPVLSFSGNNQVLCSGNSTVAINLLSNLSAAAAAGVTYSWSSTQPNGMSGVSTSGLNVIPVQTLVNASSAPITISYIGSITYTNNAFACQGSNATYQVTVNPLPVVTATVASPTICSGDTAIVCFTSPVVGTNFVFTGIASNGITGVQNGNGNCLSQILVNALLTQGNATYSVVGTANGCTGTPVTATVLINPNPTVTAMNNAVVCPGQAIPNQTFASTPAGATFNWVNSNPSIGLNASGNGAIPGWVAPVNSSGGSFVGNISVNATLNGCVGSNVSFSVTVSPTPTLTVNPQSIVICSGSNAVINCNSNVSNATLNWVAAAVNTNGASNGNGNAVNGNFVISQALSTSINAVGNVTYTITPQANGCVGSPVQVPVTVNPVPVANINPLGQTICSGNPTLLIISGNIPGINYGWTISNNQNITGASAGSGDTIAQVLTSSSTGAQTLTYSVTPSLNGCNGNIVNAVVTVNPTPVLTPVVNGATICSGASTNIVLNSNVLNTTYAYTANSNNGIIGASSGTTTPIVQQLTNPNLSPGQVIYNIIPSANACNGAPVSVTITVNPVASVIPSQNTIVICSGQSANVQFLSNAPGATFNWSVSQNPQVSGQAAGSGNAISQVLTNNTFAVQNFNYLVVPVFGVCPGNQFTIPVTVNPLPQIVAGQLLNTCASTAPFNLTGYSPAGGTWSGTGITNGQLGTFSPQVSGIGQFQLTYSYTNPITGCINSGIRTVVVNALPVPLFTMDTLKCTNTTVSIVNNSTGASTYNWNFGNGATSTQVNPLYQYPQGGNYTVWLTATSAQGCVDSTSHAIQIITTPTPSYVPSVYSGCGPLSVNFNNTTTGSFINSYFWNFGFPANGPFSNAQNPGTIVFPAPWVQDTNYVISLSATNQCGTANFLDTILVHPLPIAGFATTVNTGCSPLSVGFLNTSAGSPTNYIWNFGDGSFSTQNSPTHVFVYGPNDTIFNVSLIAINACGSDTAYYPIHVFPNTVTSFFNTTPTSGCAPLNVQFTNFSVGANNYYWNFGDGQVTNATSPSHLYTSSGTFIAQLIVDNGCSFDTSQITITVLAKPLVSFTVANDTLCTSQVFSFTNTSSQLSNVVWNFGNGATSNVYSPSYTYQNGGSYIVSMIGTSASNGCVDTAYQFIQAIPSPNIVYDTNVYEGCVTFSASFNETSGTASSAVWDYGDGNIGISPSSSHYYTTAGTYYPQVVAQNAFGCTDTADFTVVVHPKPLSDFDIPIKTSCTVPFNVITTNNSQGALIYNWNFGNGTTSNQFSPVGTYLQSGSYQIVLMVYNQFGCGDTSVQAVIVHPIPIAGFTPDTTIGCEDLTVGFTNNSVNSNTYLWNFGDGTSIQAPNPIHTYMDPGFYTVTLIATNIFGCKDTLINPNLIQVLQRPQAAFTVSPSILYTEDAFVNLTNLATNYQTGEYDFGNGIVYNINTEIYNYGTADSGDYVITQVVYNQFGCSDTAYAYIHINLSPTLYVPNAFTPDLDGENDGWIPVATGVGEIEVSVFNRWGEEIFNTKDLSVKWDGTYQGKDCPVGVYSWKIIARDINAELIVKSGHIVLLR